MSTENDPVTEKTLAAVGHDIVKIFASLESDSIRDFKGIRRDDLFEQQERFDLWATNIGLYQRGHASLDYRFRDASTIYQYCRKLLEDLMNTLSILRSELADQSADIVSNVSSDEQEVSSDEDSLDGYDDETTAEAALASVVDCIDRLFRLSMKIRNPSTRTGLSRGYTFRRIDETTKVDVFDCFEKSKIDEEHIINALQHNVSDKSSTCEIPSFLLHRLAKANNQRRRQFAYWRHHKQKLDSNDDRAVARRQRQHEQQQQQQRQTGDITLLKVHSTSQRSKPTTATFLDHKKIKIEDDAQSVVSTMSMKIPELVGMSEEVAVFPDVPEKYVSQENVKEFECPYCHTICSRRLLNQREWRAHILKDIRPYVCTYEECSSGTQMYDSYGDWFGHECTHRNRSIDPEDRNCPLCLRVTPNDDAAARHLASHLVRIALFTLPRSTGIELELDEQSAGTNRNIVESRTDRSNDLISAATSLKFSDNGPQTSRHDFSSSDTGNIQIDPEDQQYNLGPSAISGLSNMDARDEELESFDKVEDMEVTAELTDPRKSVVDLLHASGQGNVAVIEQLLKKGVDVNGFDSESDRTALQAASIYGDERVVKLLLEAGADANAQGGHFGSALQAASVYGDERVVKLLLEAGADVNAQGGYYGDALQAASVYGDERVVKLLLEAGADVNAQRGHYGSAIQAASASRHKWVVKLLLEAGVDVNAHGGHYGSALQAASVYGDERVVKLLLEAGADANAQGGHFGSALQAASASGHERVVKLLLEAGADVNAQGGYHSSALRAARAEGHQHVIDLLMKHGVRSSRVEGKDED